MSTRTYTANDVHRIFFKATDNPETLTDEEERLIQEYDRGFRREYAIRDKRAKDEREAQLRPQPAKPAAQSFDPNRWRVIGKDEDIIDYINAHERHNIKGWHFEVALKALFSVADQLDAVRQRLDALEASRTAPERVAELDTHVRKIETRLDDISRRGLSYRGVHEPGARYVMGDVVSQGGSMWCCVTHSTLRGPGEDHDSWQLCVKRGRDGKDR